MFSETWLGPRLEGVRSTGQCSNPYVPLCAGREPLAALGHHQGAGCHVPRSVCGRHRAVCLHHHSHLPEVCPYILFRIWCFIECYCLSGVSVSFLQASMGQACLPLWQRGAQNTCCLENYRCEAYGVPCSRLLHVDEKTIFGSMLLTVCPVVAAVRLGS